MKVMSTNLKTSTGTAPGKISPSMNYSSMAAEKESEGSISRRILLEHAMKLYGISYEDLNNSSYIVSKLRETNIDTVLN